MTRPFQRARKPEEKEQRREHLLGTARRLLAEGRGLPALSLNELARQAGMAKANVYRYFESREALLLALLWDEWVRWFESFRGSPSARATRSLDVLAARLARSLAAQPLLCLLTAALPSVIEQNLSEQAIRDFKRETRSLFEEVAEALAGICPALTAAQYAELLHDTARIVMGLHPSCHPARAAERVLEAPELRFFRRDFGDELERFVQALAAHHAGSTARSAPARRARRRS